MSLEIDSKLILEQVNIVLVIQECISLQRKGNNYIGLCPFHNDKTPSLVVSESKQIFKCFACNVGGNAIKFFMLFHNLTLKKALLKICQQFNIKIDQKWEKEFQISESAQEINKINQQAKIFFQLNLINSVNPELQKYCQKRRITSQIKEKFQIGWMGNDGQKLWEYLQQKNFSDLSILNSDLFQLNQQEKPISYFQNRLIFPIEDENGYAVGFIGRIINVKSSNNPKYLNSKENESFIKSKVLYNFFFINQNFKGTQIVYLVEGLFDSIQLILHNHPAIALMGTNLSWDQINLIKERYQKIIIFPDNDSAGIESTIKNSLILFQNKINVQIITQKIGKDADECMQQKNFNLDEVLKLHPVDFIIDQYPTTANVEQIQQMLNKINLFFPLLHGLQIFKIKEKISKKYSLPREVLNTEFANKARDNLPSAKKKNSSEAEWKQLFFTKLLYHPEIIKSTKKIKGTFNHLNYDFYYEKLVQWYNGQVSKDKLTFANFLRSLEKDKKELLITIYNNNKDKEEVISADPKFTKDCINWFEIEQLNLEIHKLKEKLRQTGNVELLSQIQKINGKKRKIENDLKKHSG